MERIYCHLWVLMLSTHGYAPPPKFIFGSTPVVYFILTFALLFSLRPWPVLVSPSTIKKALATVLVIAQDAETIKKLVALVLCQWTMDRRKMVKTDCSVGYLTFGFCS